MFTTYLLEKEKPFGFHQGYNGTFSHQNENSLDFIMPEGTEVLAARDGTVIDIVQSNNKSCPTRSCAPFGNYVSILHPDGTIAQYYHLEQNGVQIKLGDRVTKGQFIAYSGNTGWSSGLIFISMCIFQVRRQRRTEFTVKTLFKTGHGDKVHYLEEGKSYARGY